jgi:hypothetical protein
MSRGGSPGAGGASNLGGAGGASGVGGVSDPAADIRIQPTVWIGEVESAVTVGAVGTQEPQKVILILDAVTTTSITGTVTFGEGPLPSADSSYPSDEYAPSPGYPYSLLSSELKGDRLSLNLAPLESLALWCAVQTPDRVGTACDCSVNPCQSAKQPLRGFELVVAGNTMAGEMTRPSGDWLGGVPAIRLHRVQ